MRIDDVVYFSPSTRIKDLNFDNIEALISAFKERIESYYFDPAEFLNQKKMAFASGIMTMTAIDALCYFQYPGITGNGARQRRFYFEHIIPSLRSQTDKDCLAKDIVEFYRNGLIHEGRVKNCAQFSYDYSEMIFEAEGFLIINPKLLLKQTQEYFNSYISNEANFEQIARIIRKQYRKEVELLLQN
jgi:hypothetical protein